MRRREFVVAVGSAAVDLLRSLSVQAQQSDKVKRVVFTTQRTKIAELALKNRLPKMYGHNDMVQAGGLMTYGPDYGDLYRRATEHVHKILKGAKPSDLPVEQPTKFELIINLKTARALGLTIPPTLLAQANELIE